VKEGPEGVFYGAHGSIWRFGWRLRARKKVVVVVISQSEDVLVRVTIEPSMGNLIDVALMEKETQSNWRALPNDLSYRIELGISTPSSPALAMAR